VWPHGDDTSASSRYFVASEDAVRLSEEADRLVERAVGIEWYEQGGSDIDRAALALCRLRRAGAGDKGGPRHGDEAVRQALAETSAPALVWLVSRAVSYMDESGFPEAVGPWFPDEGLET
jgi:hypothetical protein